MLWYRASINTQCVSFHEVRTDDRTCSVPAQGGIRMKVSALGCPRQEDYKFGAGMSEFKINLSYILRSRPE